MMGWWLLSYLDTILVPLSLFATAGYHAYLWHNFKHRPYITTIGINALKRREWVIGIKENDEKKEMLAVQSLRNSLMSAILTGTITILINIGVTYIANCSYGYSPSAGGRRHWRSAGEVILFSAAATTKSSSSSQVIVLLKYGSATTFLLASFLFSSLGIGLLVDSNYILNSPNIPQNYKKKVFERGCLLAVVGNRLLCLAVPIVTWMLGPVPLALSSFALVWGLYSLDFPSTTNYYYYYANKH